MARVKLPSYIAELNGRMEDAVIYRSGSRICMRIYVKPHNPRTEAQQANRRLFAEAMAAWKKLSDEEKYHYRKRTRRLNMLPHNLFVKEYMQGHSGENMQVVSSESGKSLYISPSFQLKCPSEATPPENGRLKHGLYTDRISCKAREEHEDKWRDRCGGDCREYKFII